jgi:hypothetical protein
VPVGAALLFYGLAARQAATGHCCSWRPSFGSCSSRTRLAARVANPWNDFRPHAFSLTFFAFSLVCYLILYSFAHFLGWVQKASPRPV